MRIFLDTLAKTATVSLGSQALAVESMDVITRVMPHAKFVMLSPNPDVDRHYLKHEPYDVELVQRSNSQLGSAMNMISIMGRVDAVVSVLGDGYITTHPHKLVQKSLFFKRPAVMFPSSMGPFLGGYKRSLTILGLSKFDVVMARDTVTHEYLRSLNIKNLHLLPDIAFALAPAQENRVVEILSREGVSTDKKIIALNVSQLLNRLFSKKGMDYVRFMRRLIIALTKYDANVLLIPHQIFPDTIQRKQSQSAMFGGDDRIALHEIMKDFEGADHCMAITGDYSAREMKGVIGQCEIMIAGRLHPTVGALSMNVPSVIMQYSHKSVGVMDHLGLRDYVWDIDTTFEELLGIIEKAWVNRAVLRKSLMEQMPKIRKDVYKAGEILVDVISQYERKS